MLTNEQFEQLLIEIGVPQSGQRLVSKARQKAPIREVKSTGSNVITILASLKMAREVATESYKVEYVAAMEHELSAEVLEYYPQPCKLKLELLNPVSGEVFAIDHVPDFLLIEKTRVVLQEWKSEEKLAYLAQRQPFRYEKLNGRWRSPQIEEQLASHGIVYEVHSSSEIHPNRTKNLETLRDYMCPESPACSKGMVQRLTSVLAHEGKLSLGDLLDDPYDFQSDELLRALSEGHVAFDLDSALVSNPHQFLVYRDKTLMGLCVATSGNQPGVSGLDFSMPIAVGVQFKYDGQILEICLVGEQEVIAQHLGGAGGKQTVTLSRDWLVSALHNKQIQVIKNISGDGLDVSAFLAHDNQSLAQAEMKAKYLAMPYDPKTTPFSERTYFRLLAQQSRGEANGQNEILSITPRHCDKGNRTARLSPEQTAAMEDIRSSQYNSTKSPNAKSVYQQLVVQCKGANITPPSYPTFLKFLKALENNYVRKIRGGKRMAYQQKEFWFSLSYDTPRHGVRPFEVVHIDHTLLDAELNDQRSGSNLGRPWLTLLLDAFSRRIMAMHLGFFQPDRSTVLMVFRDFVKRWGRLPDMVISDNGKDLVSDDVRTFLTSLRVNLRLRPAGQPRAGSILERMFGTLNTALIHNLDGNTKLTKNVRQLSGTHLPSKLANWNLDNLYTVLDYWAYELYDSEYHPALGNSPREIFSKAMNETGSRSFRAIAFNRDFVIATCPTVDRKGERRIDRQRGVKVNNFYYYHEQFDSLLLSKKTVLVRFDPHDISRVFVKLSAHEWVEARCMALMHLPRLNQRQHKSISAEYFKVHSMAGKSKSDMVSAPQLCEFIATLKLGSKELKEACALGEVEALQERLKLIDPEAREGTRPKVFGYAALQDYTLELSRGTRVTPNDCSGLETGGSVSGTKTVTDADDDSGFVYGDLL